jgi:hypothetical protein
VVIIHQTTPYLTHEYRENESFFLIVSLQLPVKVSRLSPAASTSKTVQCQSSCQRNYPTMSRHKMIKNLDLDDELDDFDGGEDYDDGEGGEGKCRV